MVHSTVSKYFESKFKHVRTLSLDSSNRRPKFEKSRYNFSIRRIAHRFTMTSTLWRPLVCEGNSLLFRCFIRDTKSTTDLWPVIDSMYDIYIYQFNDTHISFRFVDFDWVHSLVDCTLCWPKCRIRSKPVYEYDCLVSSSHFCYAYSPGVCFWSVFRQRNRDTLLQSYYRPSHGKPCTETIRKSKR